MMVLLMLLASASSSEGELERGQVVYQRACAACHGREGDGQAQAATWLDPRPRDFTQGVFKFRTTMSGSNPTDDDLMRTVRRGIPGTSMPAWEGRLSEGELRAVVAWIKARSDWFDVPVEPDEIIVTAMQLAERPERTEGAVRAGADVYERMQCAKCHGEDGRGNPDNELEDDLGRPIVAFDFTTGVYKGGGSFEDIYRSFTTGLDGTPMPSYDASLTEDERWELVYFVYSLRRRGFFHWIVRGPSWNHRRDHSE